MHNDIKMIKLLATLFAILLLGGCQSMSGSYAAAPSAAPYPNQWDTDYYYRQSLNNHYHDYPRQR